MKTVRKLGPLLGAIVLQGYALQAAVEINPLAALGCSVLVLGFAWLAGFEVGEDR